MRLDFPDAVRRFVEHGRLGQKSGAGWYRYASDAQGKRRKEVDSASASVLQGVRPAGAPVMKDEEILARLMLPMMLEAVRCLQDRIVATPAEVDMSLVLGLGFPRHVGGPCKYVDRLGADEVIRRCESLSHLGPLYEPNSLLRERAATRSSFYTIGSVS